MFDHLRAAKLHRRAPGQRRLRLFAAACYRRVWGSLRDPQLRATVEAAERFADRALTLKGFLDVVRDTTGAARGLANACFSFLASDPADAAVRLARSKKAERAAQASLLRCIFGDPFRPVSIGPAERTPTVVQLAQAAYNERALPSGELDAQRLAVLADALEEAGSTDAKLLEHLPEPGGHVRGCWGVDLVLRRG
jgi:hypothetical protein